MRAILFSVLLLSFSVSAAEVYRTVDENGNIVYSDKPLTGESESMDLPPLSIMDPVQVPPVRLAPRANGDAAEPFADLTFTSPESEESLWGTAATVEFSLTSATPLGRGQEVVVFIDGKERMRSNSMSGSITEVVRGEHRISAQIVNSDNDVIASAGPVVFFMKQQSVLNPNNPQNRP